MCYYDVLERSWVVREPGGRCLPRHASPVAEKDTFVIFDEARCRGADLQLLPQAVGLLTLGPTTGKDKMMQAAGRLRMLGKGQELHFATTVDITSKIRLLNHLHQSNSSSASSGSSAEAPPKAVHVLQWVIYNTVQANQQGVVASSQQGLFFASCIGNPDAALQPEVHDLMNLYGHMRSPQPAPDLVVALSNQKSVRNACSHNNPTGKLRSSQLVQEILNRSALHGSGHMEMTGGLSADEECERELEQEEEEEEEVERQVARMTAASEKVIIIINCVTIAYIDIYYLDKMSVPSIP